MNTTNTNESILTTTFLGLCHAKNGAQLIPLSPDEVEWLPKSLVRLTDIQQWKPRTGLAVDKLRNSRFCTPAYIGMLAEARSRACVLQKDNSTFLEEILEKTSPSHLVCLGKNTSGVAAVLDKLVQLVDTKPGLVIGVNLDQKCNNFSGYFQKSGLEFRSVQCSMLSKDDGTGMTDQKVGAIIASALPTENCSLGDEELVSRHSLLCVCQMALQQLSMKGTFVCHMYETLSRFTAGILYILHHCFENITIIKPVTSPLHHPERFLVCKGFCGCEDQVRSFLEATFNELTNSDPSCELLEIVPVEFLYEEAFYWFLKRNNEQLAHLQVQSIVRLEHFYQYPEVLPPEEDLIKLKEEIANYVHV